MLRWRRLATRDFARTGEGIEGTPLRALYMPAHRDLGLVGTAVQNGFGDGLVFREGRLGLLARHDGAPLEHQDRYLELVENLRQAGISRQLDDRAVEQLVVLDEGLALGRIAASYPFPHRQEAPAMVAFIDSFGCAARRLALQYGPDLEKIRHFAWRQALHRDAAIRYQADEPFGRKPAKGLAERAAAVADLFRQVTQYQPLTRRKPAGDDSLPDGLENGVDRFAVPVRFSGRCASPRV